MPLPMSPTDSVFLTVESANQPMHVGGLELFVPPDGADATDVAAMFTKMAGDTAPPMFRRRPVRSVLSAGTWSWREDADLDLAYHVRRNSLPEPGRTRELLALCSRLHSTRLDRSRPLWEAHLIEGLADGRFAVYFKAHHALMDGIAAQRLVQQVLSTDPDERDQPPPWAFHPPPTEPDSADASPISLHSLTTVLSLLGDAAGLPAVLAKSARRALGHRSGSLSIDAPNTVFNVPVSSARRFAAQSWPMDRIRRVRRGTDMTANDVVLAMCAGALRRYLLAADALPDRPLIALVPVSLRSRNRTATEGNSIGALMCNLATDEVDPAVRLARISQSMADGKDALASLSPRQIQAMSAIGMSPLVLQPLLHLQGVTRPPFNLIISNVPGSRRPLFYNGARLDGQYPLSIPLDGQALNITCTSYAGTMAFGLTGCRETVPHLQRMLDYLEDELAALEIASGQA